MIPVGRACPVGFTSPAPPVWWWVSSRESEGPLQRRPRKIRRLLSVLALLGTACALPSGDSGLGGDPREGFTRKKVGEKHPHTVLVAVDRTTCIVSPEKYDETSPGDFVWCYWRSDGARPGDLDGFGVSQSRAGWRLTPSGTSSA